MNSNGTCRNLSVKIQKGSTCWFHSSLNGWILSDRGRRILKQYLNKYKQTPNYIKFKQYENLQACPMRGKLRLAYIWAYIDAVLSKTLNVNRPELQEQVIISNTGIRNAKQSGNGGTFWDTIELAKILFPGMKIDTKVDSNPDILYMTTDKSPSRIPGYILSHASIIVQERLRPGGHMMTGFICNDMELIHDSASNKIFKLNWTKGQSEINKLLRWGGILRTGRSRFVFLNEKLFNRPNNANMNALRMVGYMAIKTNNGGYLKNSNGKTIYMKAQKNAYGMWKKMNNNKYLKNNSGKFVLIRG